jgi:hypothetical protein
LRRAHQRFLLEADARAIAKLKNYEFGGYYQNDTRHVGRLFFVPDQTLLLEEEENLGIRDANDLYGGCGSQPIYKNESDLSSARRRWCTPPGGLVTTFRAADSRIAAPRCNMRSAASL